MTPCAAAHFTLTLATDIARSMWELRPGGTAHTMSALEYERRLVLELAGVEE